MNSMCREVCVIFFFQAEDGIRDIGVTGVQTCALPICEVEAPLGLHHVGELPDDVPVLAIELQLHLGLVLLQVLGAHRGSPDTGRMTPSSTIAPEPVSWTPRAACASRARTTLTKRFRCSGQGPYRCRAASCAAVL